MRSAGVWLSVTACTPEIPEAPRTPAVQEAVAADVTVEAAAATDRRDVRGSRGRAGGRGGAAERGRSRVRWLAAGGGSTPEFNQVSIEQDLGLVPEVLGAGGLLLFAGGRGSGRGAGRGDRRERRTRCWASSAICSRRAAVASGECTGRPTLTVDAAATVDNVLAALATASATAEEAPLVVYLAGHGQRRARRRATRRSTCGGSRRCGRSTWRRRSTRAAADEAGDHELLLGRVRRAGVRRRRRAGTGGGAGAAGCSRRRRSARRRAATRTRTGRPSRATGCTF
jgi:hypothetical protein